MDKQLEQGRVQQTDGSFQKLIRLCSGFWLKREEMAFEANLKR